MQTSAPPNTVFLTLYCCPTFVRLSYFYFMACPLQIFVTVFTVYHTLQTNCVMFSVLLDVLLLSRQCGLLLVPVDAALKRQVGIKQVGRWI